MLTTTDPVRPSDARLRRAQALAHHSGAAIQIQYRRMRYRTCFVYLAGALWESSSASTDSSALGTANCATPQPRQTRSCGNTQTIGLSRFSSPGKCMATSPLNSRSRSEPQQAHFMFIGTVSLLRSGLNCCANTGFDIATPITALFSRIDSAAGKQFETLEAILANDHRHSWRSKGHVRPEPIATVITSFV